LSHRWASRGEKRTIILDYTPNESILAYLKDMRDALRMALAYGYVLARENDGKVPSPIALRRKLRGWFNPRYDYAKHHINPLCRNAAALLKSYKKKHKHLAIPEVKRLATRIDSELFKIEYTDDGKVSIRLTIKPFNYEYITFTPEHKKWNEYGNGRASELLITDRKLYVTLVTNEIEAKEKPLASRFIASDLNFTTIDSTIASKRDDGAIKLERVQTEPIRQITKIQSDFSRRRRRLQLHVENPQKRDRKLRQTRGRQRNRIKDALHKLSTEQVRKNPDSSFIFEKLTGIRKNKDAERSKKLRTYLNRWPYRMYQSMVEYKSPHRTLYVNPGGTSSRCPVCGDKLEHPTWAVSRCRKCGADHARDRLASLAILLRGLHLCGQPFAVSADASWQLLRNEYLYAPAVPDSWRAGWTEEAANAPNRNTVHEHTHS